jgi:hypothetical protein
MTRRIIDSGTRSPGEMVMRRETPTVPERAAPDRLDDHPLNGGLRRDPSGSATSHSADPVIEAFSRQLTERFREVPPGRSSGSAGSFRSPRPAWWFDRPRMLLPAVSFCLGAGLAAAGILSFPDLRGGARAPTAQAAASAPEPVKAIVAAASPSTPHPLQAAPPPPVASSVAADRPTPIQPRAVAASLEPSPVLAAPVQEATVAEALAAGAIMELQELLKSLGLDPGPIDGVGGPMTTAAITKYEERAGLPLSGTPSWKLLERLKERHSPKTASNAP